MKAEYDLALSNLKRSEDLASRKFISSSAQDTAASNAQVAEAKLKLAQARLSKMRIVAPFDGVVGIRGVSLGDYVKDGADLVNVECAHPEGRLSIARAQSDTDQSRARHRSGRRCASGERFAGRSTRSIHESTPTGGRWRSVRGLENTAGKLRPGMFVRVRVIVGERANALLVPEEAIVPQGAVFRLQGSSTGKRGACR